MRRPAFWGAPSMPPCPQVCPAGWQPGGKSIKTSADGSLEYFGAQDKDESEEFGQLLKPIHAPSEFFALRDKEKKPLVADFYAPWRVTCQLLPLDMMNAYSGSCCLAMLIFLAQIVQVWQVPPDCALRGEAAGAPGPHACTCMCRIYVTGRG